MPKKLPKKLEIDTTTTLHGPSQKELFAIRERLNAATAGPWKAVDAGAPRREVIGFKEEFLTTCEDVSILTVDDLEVLGCSEWMRCKPADLEFMAHAREDIERLLSLVPAWCWEPKKASKFRR